MNSSKNAWRTRAIVLGVAACAIAAPALATHSWNNYHWKRTTLEISPPVGDNVSGVWDAHLVTAVNDWNLSTVINSPLVPGSTTPKQCSPVAGTIQVCNDRYGQRGWLGIATIWLSGGHISQGTTKLNDTYFNMAQYNTPSWRQLVTCQEIGHDYGLGHQDENFSTDNTTSCMDYTNQPAGNEHPDAHDYQQLLLIYDHLETAAMTLGSRTASASAPGDTPAEWGRPVHYTADGRPDVFIKMEAQGPKITHVFWAIGEGPRGNHAD
jgi:hypothetical protein